MRPEARPDAVTGCQILEWDSEFFGCRIARIDPSLVAAEGMRAVDDWCASRHIDCAYLLANSDDQSTCEQAQAHGFKLVDVRVTLESGSLRSASPLPHDNGPLVRPARTDDVESLTTIAGESHRDTRFYMDGRFDRRRCDQMYELWIAKSCRGWADRVFVVEKDKDPIGYLTCHVRNHAGRLGLVAVSPSSRGHGAGTALLVAALDWFREQNAVRVSVATQGRNQASLRLYQRAGMSVKSIQLWFHKWW